MLYTLTSYKVGSNGCCLQEKDEHLELLEGMLIDLLKTKWNTFVKFRFYRQFILFSCYFLISLVCFTLRPGPPGEHAVNSTVFNSSIVINETDIVTDMGKLRYSYKNQIISTNYFAIISLAYLLLDFSLSLYLLVCILSPLVIWSDMIVFDIIKMKSFVYNGFKRYY